MYRLLLCLFLTVAFEAGAKEVFKGGKSDISSRDRKRADKAIKKWTSKDGKQKGVLLTEEPWLWDYKKVGRPVFIRIIKNDNRDGLLEVWTENPASRKYEHLKTYQIARFSGDLGPKLAEGDYQAPEGFYYITRKRMNPKSNYHLSMDIGFPNEYDLAKKRTGSYIMIHGSSVSIGCFAMTDCSIEQIYTLVDGALKKGQEFVRVHSFPFEMTDENLEKHKDSEHYDFWKNLKQGWDWFEKNRRPPDVGVKNGNYTFSES